MTGQVKLDIIYLFFHDVYALGSDRTLLAIARTTWPAERVERLGPGQQPPISVIRRVAGLPNHEVRDENAEKRRRGTLGYRFQVEFRLWMPFESLCWMLVHSGDRNF